ncbi:hypothetical protein COHA_007569 [Chlorella ohadii]|uniref:Uncharacterized protein n=1 Tax=Chlorella ohadii TaxID=2649997 RepID=A0AAD5H434_9CHLO|nr:hypothetical protein COHA_007569 [Chlorella ohadii]
MQVGDAVLGGCAVEGYNRAAGTVQELQLRSIESVPGLQQPVAAALPPGIRPSQLRRLGIFGSNLPLQSVVDCPFLAHLTSLELVSCSSTSYSGSAAPVIQALLEQAPGLLSLTLMRCSTHHLRLQGLQPLPPALINLAGLQHLSLADNGLTELPPGPYLSGLESLDLSCNNLDRLPPALTAASSLTSLSLARSNRLVLNDADIDDVLSHLTHLRRLHLDVGRMPLHVLGQLSQRMPQLHISEVA